MKVSLIIPTMDRGGAEKQVAILARGLADRGVEVDVVLLTRGGPRETELDHPGVTRVLIGKRLKFDPACWWRLRRYLARRRPDVVHTFLFAANAYGRSAAASVGVPVIIGSERCVDPWKARWQHSVDRRLMKVTDALTTNSPGVVEFYRSVGVPAEAFTVIDNAIGSAPPTMPRAEARESLGVSPDCRLIVAVGRLWPQKRIRDLIWAAELVATLIEDVQLVIVGDGPQRDALIRHRDRVTFPHRVWFAGGRDDVARWLPHASAFWIASEYEGQSNAVLEAMRAGVPVIASDIAGNRDLIDPGQTGWLFPVGDEAELATRTRWVLEHPEPAAEVARAGRRMVAERFTIERMIDQHLNLYRRLLSAESEASRSL